MCVTEFYLLTGRFVCVIPIRPQLQIKSIEPSAIKRVVNVWIESTEADSKQCLKNVIDSVGSIQAIHNINQAVAELGESNAVTRNSITDVSE